MFSLNIYVRGKRIYIALFALFMVSSGCYAQQDTLVKTNGEVIPAKILEINQNDILFKRADNMEGPTFIENKSDISYIKYKNGQVQDFSTGEKTPGKPAVNTSPTPTTNSNQQAVNTYTPEPSAGNRYFIDHIGRKYTVNGQKVGRKDLDRQLARSKNPAVLAALKTAKATKIAQKIIGLTSIPTTIGGSIASIITFIDCYNAVQNGTAGFQSYLNAGLSFIGTLSFPITSKILKKRRDKLYDKTIDLYNITN